MNKKGKEMFKKILFSAAIGLAVVSTFGCKGLGGFELDMGAKGGNQSQTNNQSVVIGAPTPAPSPTATASPSPAQ